MKKAVLTGHSKGLGKALAKTLIEKGFDVLGISRSCSQDFNGLQQVALDLSDGRAVLKWIDSGVLKKFFKETEQAVLINNSGVVSPVNPLGRQANEDILRSVNLNVSAPLILSNAFVKNTGGILDRRILHISSGAGRDAYSSWSVYCATKAALDHHARAVHEDAVTNLKISSLAPGIVDTGMQADIRSCSADDFPMVGDFQALKTRGQLASPEETAAKIVAFLCSRQFGKELVTDIRVIGSA